VQHFFALDALRGIAAIIVLLFHVHRWVPGLPAFESGYLAVDFFFMLSGFVIASAYSKKLENRQLSFGDFLILRLIRLYPMVFVGASLGAVALIASSLRHANIDMDIKSILLSFLLIPQPSASHLFPTNIPLWSLFFELSVNLAFAATLPFAGKKIALTVTVTAGSFLLLWFSAHSTSVAQIDFYAQFARCTFPFMVGVTIFHVRPMLPFAKPPSSLFPSIAALIVILSINGGALIGTTPYEFMCIVVLFPLIVFYSSNVEPTAKGKAVSKILGEVSYPLYTTHGPITSAMEIAFGHVGIAPGVLLECLCPPVVVAINLALARYWDAPVRRLLKHKWERMNGRKGAGVDGSLTVVEKI
jgi:peptidoglycan/LPS O-acetylase OafA/YrhL